MNAERIKELSITEITMFVQEGRGELPEGFNVEDCSSSEISALCTSYGVEAIKVLENGVILSN